MNSMLMTQKKYRILAIHNYFRNRGGEDVVFDTETALLESAGHEVIRYTLHNDQIAENSPLRLARTTLWNAQAESDTKRLIRSSQPHIAHIHNAFPLASVSTYHALRSSDVPTVQTLHDYRFFCMNGLLFRENAVCELCLQRGLQLPGVLHRCYRNNRAASAVALLINLTHRMFGTWSRTVDTFIALTELSRQKYIQAGILEHKITVKANCVFPAPAVGSGSGGYALFVGRLSPEKGIDMLLSAWKSLGSSGVLRIIGDGPMEPQVRMAAANTPSIQYLGWLDSRAVIEAMQQAQCLVVPSIWNEGLPRVIVEAFACGLPVITGNIGNTALLVRDGETGRLCRAGDPLDLADKLRLMFDAPTAWGRMRSTCRQEFELRYNPELNLRTLEDIYASTIGLRATNA